MDFKEFLELSGYSNNTKMQYSLYASKIESQEITQDNITALCLKYNNPVFRALLAVYLTNFLERTDIKVPKFKGKRIKRLPKFLEPNEIELLITNADIKLALILRIAWESGMRISEILSLTQENIAKDTVIGKGGEEARIFITDGLKSLINDYTKAEGVGPQSRIFSGSRFCVNERLAKLSKKVLEKRVSPHMFRHSIAMKLRREGMDLAQVKEFLRHKNISTTEIYARATKEEVEKKWKEIMTKH